MQRQLLKQTSILYQLIAICGAGLLLGMAIVKLPAIFLLAGMAGIIFIAIAWVWPEIAILVILVMTSSVFEKSVLPSISIGFGHILIPDILLFVLIGIIFLRILLRSSSFIHTPLDIPLLAFYFTALLATAVAISYSRVTFSHSLGEVRIVNYYLIFFAVTNLVRNEKQLRRLYSGIVLMAIFVALAMIAQSALGSAIHILPGRVETLDTAGTVSYGVTRVLPPGQSLVLVVFICVAVQMLFDKRTSRFMIYLIQFGIVGLAVILTFTRSFWVTCVLALALVGILVSFKDKVKFFQIVLGIVLIGALILTPFLAINKGGELQNVISGFTVRMSSLFDTNVTREDSLKYRYIENGYAYPQIASHPLIGLGLGVDYRPVDQRIMASPTTFIHNGHLWVMLKTGLIGYSFFMLFLLIFVIRAIQNWRHIRDPILKGTVLSFAATIVGLMVAAIVFSIFRDDYWTPVIGVMLGMGEVILRINHEKPLDVQAAEKLV